jgi:hypothetical protein
LSFVKTLAGTSAGNAHFPRMGYFRRAGFFLVFYALSAALPAFPAIAGDPALPDRAPIPARCPQTRCPPAATDAGRLELPAEAPEPAEKPAPSGEETAGRLEAKPKRERPSPPAAPAQLACRADLEKLGVGFTEKPPIATASGCAIANPLEVTSLSHSITVKPAAIVNCALSDALSRFLTDSVSPEARKIFDSPLAGIQQASAYVCRDRHGTQTVSEHAFGNAIDIASFILKDGTVIDVKDYAGSDPKRSQFLTDVRKAACGPFRTVLGPGADADHSLHFHFDLEPRRSLRPFCQ